MEYLKLLPGDRVILRRHRTLKGSDGDSSDDWSSYMDEFVNKETTITRFALYETGPRTNIPLYKVDIDNQYWYWRISDITILPNLRNINHPYFTAKRMNQTLPKGMF